MSHPLTDWLRAAGKTVRDFAEDLDVNESTIHRMIHGKTDTSTALFRKVEEATAGAVTQEACFTAWLNARRRREEKGGGSNSGHLLSEEASK